MLPYQRNPSNQNIDVEEGEVAGSHHQPQRAHQPKPEGTMDRGQGPRTRIIGYLLNISSKLINIFTGRGQDMHGGDGREPHLQKRYHDSPPIFSKLDIFLNFAAE